MNINVCMRKTILQCICPGPFSKSTPNSMTNQLDFNGVTIGVTFLVATSGSPLLAARSHPFLIVLEFIVNTTTPWTRGNERPENQVYVIRVLNMELLRCKSR